MRCWCSSDACRLFSLTCVAPHAPRHVCRLVLPPRPAGLLTALALFTHTLPRGCLPLTAVNRRYSSPFASLAGLLTALALFIHNFPEGLATFVGALADTKVGVGLGEHPSTLYSLPVLRYCSVSML